MFRGYRIVSINSLGTSPLSTWTTLEDAQNLVNIWSSSVSSDLSLAVESRRHVLSHYRQGGS